MTLEAFAPSQPLTLGVELELQLLSTHDYDLTPYAADMLRLMRQHHPDLPGTVVPEMTRSMIEISTGICQDGADALAQLLLQLQNHREKHIIRFTFTAVRDWEKPTLCTPSDTLF